MGGEGRFATSRKRGNQKENTKKLQHRMNTPNHHTSEQHKSSKKKRRSSHSSQSAQDMRETFGDGAANTNTPAANWFMSVFKSEGEKTHTAVLAIINDIDVRPAFKNTAIADEAHFPPGAGHSAFVPIHG